jgi:hypothetical protein
MSTVPKGRADRLEFYSGRVDRWVQNAQAMGVNADLVASLQARTIEAQEALAAQYEARLKARGATARFNDAMREVRKLGADVLLQIQGNVGTVGPEIYELATIDPPKKQSPMAPPGEPYAFESELSPIGRLKLTWKCKNPKGAEGTMYHVSRRIGFSGPLVQLGVAGKKSFIDATLPRGVAMVMYQIQATRATGKGPAALFSVNFGTGSKMPAGPTLTPALSAR